MYVYTQRILLNADRPTRRIYESMKQIEQTVTSLKDLFQPEYDCELRTWQKTQAILPHGDTF